MSGIAISSASRIVAELRFPGQSENCLKVGDPFPNVTLARWNSKEGESETFATAAKLRNRAVIVVTVPHTASSLFHRLDLAGFREAENNLLGYFDIDRIICIARGDVADACHWMGSRGSSSIDMWVDESGDKIGIDYELQRSAMIIRNGVIEWLEIEDAASGCIKSHAQNVFEHLKLSRRWAKV